MGQRNRLGGIGIWSSGWTKAAEGDGAAYGSEYDEAAVEVEALGYSAVWLGSSPAVGFAEPLLKVTSRLTVATGVLRIWDYEATEVAAQRAALERAYPGRFLLGIGVSHGPLIGNTYARPYSTMLAYLDGLDAAPEPVPADARVLAALGPKMLELSRDRAAGAHPYLVTPEHTAKARGILGEGPLLAPEFKVVLDTDLDKARTTARGYLQAYLGFPNYTENLLRSGFTEDDLRDGGSDRLVDALFALGDEDAVAARAAEFVAAGADHLAVQVVTGDAGRPLALEEWRRLAQVLIAG